MGVKIYDITLYKLGMALVWYCLKPKITAEVLRHWLKSELSRMLLLILSGMILPILPISDLVAFIGLHLAWCRKFGLRSF